MTPLTDEAAAITPAPGSAKADAAAYARLHPVTDVYALGDCCANPHTPLPALAQVGRGVPLIADAGHVCGRTRTFSACSPW